MRTIKNLKLRIKDDNAYINYLVTIKYQILTYHV